MRIGLRPATPEAYQLLHEGTLAMAQMAREGVRVDTAYVEKTIATVKADLADREKVLAGKRQYKLWARQYGDKMSLEAPAQMGHVIFDLLGHKRNPHLVLKHDERERGRDEDDKNDEAAYEHLNDPFVQEVLAYKKLKKALGTALYGIQRETVDGYVHPSLDVVFAESYRSACRNPNLQNTNVRNKFLSQLVRSAFIPRDGHVFLEVDYSTQEVRVSYCYNKDPKLLHDILNGDMHRDRAKELFLLTDEEMGFGPEAKLVRYCGKNMFVFPGFYGSYYCQCAPNLWDAIGRLKLTTADGVSLYDHLRARGVKKLGRCDPDEEPVKGTFEYHVRQVERHQWNEVYTVYDKWKKDWWNLYLRQAGVNTLTGFRMEGNFRRNQILCMPIQGSAFHCLLWSIIRLQKVMARRKMRSKIVLQIHDSFLFDAHREELDDLIPLVHEYAVKRVAKHWPWIVCPLGIEYEIAETNWYEKRTLEVAA